MNDETSYELPQSRRGYYYEPLKDEGPFAKRLQEAGEIIGKTVAQTAADGETGGWSEIPEISMAVESFGERVGGAVGYTIGFYIDNASSIVHNANTFINQLNDFRTWSDPFSSALTGEGGSFDE